MFLPPLSVTLLTSGALTYAGYLTAKHYINSSTQDELNRIFRNTKLYVKKDDGNLLFPQVISEDKEENRKLIILNIPPGLSLTKFKNQKEPLEHFLGGAINMWSRKHLIFIEIMTAEIPNKVEFDKEFIIGRMKSNPSPFCVSIGYSKKGFIVHDMTGAGCHLLVGGTTNSGKSVFLRQLILSAALTYDPVDLQIYLIDLKGGLEFKIFESLPHVKTLAKNKEQAQGVLEFLNDEVNNRIDRIDLIEGVANAVEAGIRPFCLLVVDEFAELSDPKLHSKVDRLLRMARFAGVHAIVALQRPEAKLLPGRLKANLPATVAFRARSGIDSRIMLEHNGAADIPTLYPGRSIYQLSSDYKVQVPFISSGDVRELISEMYYPKQKNDYEGEILC